MNKFPKEFAFIWLLLNLMQKHHEKIKLAEKLVSNWQDKNENSNLLDKHVMLIPWWAFNKQLCNTFYDKFSIKKIKILKQISSEQLVQLKNILLAMVINLSYNPSEFVLIKIFFSFFICFLLFSCRVHVTFSVYYICMSQMS